MRRASELVNVLEALQILKRRGTKAFIWEGFGEFQNYLEKIAASNQSFCLLSSGKFTEHEIKMEVKKEEENDEPPE